MSTNGLRIFFITVLSIIISWYVAVLSHEYAHATMAWIFGYKSSPFDISYGSWYLIPASEAVDYASILAAGHGIQEALIGISGLTMTCCLFFISLILINQKSIQRNIFTLSIFFWLADINLMEMFSYINRTFIRGDITEFYIGLNISPLWVFIPGSIIVCAGLYRFYGYELIRLYKILPIKSVAMRRITLWFTFWILPLTIIYGGKPIEWITFSYTINVISIMMVAAILIACDPARRWVKVTRW